MIQIDYHFELFERNSLAMETCLSHKMGWISVTKEDYNKFSGSKIKDPRSRESNNGGRVNLYHATDGANFIKELTLNDKRYDIEFCPTLSHTLIGLAKFEITELRSLLKGASNDITDFYVLTEGEKNDTDESLYFLFEDIDWKNELNGVEVLFYKGQFDRDRCSARLYNRVTEYLDKIERGNIRVGPFVEILFAYLKGAVVIKDDYYNTYEIYSSCGQKRAEGLNKLYDMKFCFNNVKAMPKYETEEEIVESIGKKKVVVQTGVDKVKKELKELEEQLLKWQSRKSSLEKQVAILRKDCDTLMDENGYLSDKLKALDKVRKKLLAQEAELDLIVGGSVSKAARKIRME